MPRPNKKRNLYAFHRSSINSNYSTIIIQLPFPILVLAIRLKILQA